MEEQHAGASPTTVAPQCGSKGAAKRGGEDATKNRGRDAAEDGGDAEASKPGDGGDAAEDGDMDASPDGGMEVAKDESKDSTGGGEDAAKDLKGNESKKMGVDDLVQEEVGEEDEIKFQDKDNGDVDVDDGGGGGGDASGHAGSGGFSGDGCGGISHVGEQETDVEVQQENQGAGNDVKELQGERMEVESAVIGADIIGSEQKIEAEVNREVEREREGEGEGEGEGEHAGRKRCTWSTVAQMVGGEGRNT